MKNIADKISQTDNRIIRSFLESAKELVEGSGNANDRGPFEEPLEILGTALALAAEMPIDKFPRGVECHERLLLVLRDALEGATDDQVIESLVLGTYLHAFGVYDQEDFRYLYRYTLDSHVSIDKSHEWIKGAVSFLVCLVESNPGNILTAIREWIRYLGAPYFAPSEFIQPCARFGVNLEDEISSENIRFVESLKARPEYLAEAIQGRAFSELYGLMKEWAPDGLLSRTYRLSEEAIYKNLQRNLPANADVEKAIQFATSFFKEHGFVIDKNTSIPVKLQKLESPPPPDAMDPSIFELIPQKLRVHMLSAVSYSTPVKEFEIIYLGGPRIGRSGILIKTPTGGVLLDYGLSVANQTIPEWVPELETIDTVLISHSHLDHVGGLPILFDTFEGKWCSTEITGAVTIKLLEDALNVGTPLPPRKTDRLDRISRFVRHNIDKVAKNHVPLESGKASEVAPGILVTPIEACHIPGSVAYLLDIEGFNVLYTGDFNLDQSVLFGGANLPTTSDVIIFDGTYWGREDFDRAKVSQQLSRIIHDHGPVIIPSFAVGRSQEILVILDKLGITSTRNVMVAGMAEAITKMTGYKGKWKGLKKNKMELDADDILVAGGGMMDGGYAKHHFEQHRDNERAAVVLCGYLAPRTGGWNLLHGDEPHSCHVEYARLSAHSSASKLSGFINDCSGKKIMVHTPVGGSPKGITIPSLIDRMRFKVT